MKLTPQTKEAVRKLVALWDNGSVKQKIGLIAARGKTLPDGSYLPYVVGEGASEDFDIPMECLEELHHVKLIVLEERRKTDSKLSKTRGLQINERRVGWNILLLEELKEIVRNDFQSSNGGNTKLKYRHLSEGAKSLARKLVEHKVAGKIGVSLDLRLLRGGDTIMSVMPLDLKNDIHITPEELRYFDELASMGLLATSGFGETLTIKLQPSLFDAVENDFTDIDYSSPPTHTLINIQSPILGPVGFNTGSGSFQQIQNLQISFPELRKLLVELGLDSPELSSLIDEVEQHPNDKNHIQLALELLNRGISRLSDYGGAVAALQLAIQFITGLRI